MICPCKTREFQTAICLASRAPAGNRFTDTCFTARFAHGGERMATEDDDKPRKKISHEIGQDLSLLSVEELTERIALMNSEIERLQIAMTKKRASKDAANSFFKS
jgi:uncharacterized small protein (DUF1192 family)